MSKNDKLIAMQLLSVLKERYPTLSVSLATVKMSDSALGGFVQGLIIANLFGK